MLLSPWKALTDTAPQQLQLGHLGPVAIESEENWSWEPAATSAPSAPAAPVAAMVPPPEVKVVKLPETWIEIRSFFSQDLGNFQKNNHNRKSCC